MTTLFWPYYFEGALVFSTTQSISESLTSSIERLLWDETDYWLSTDAVKLNSKNCI
jgi:hypothetical protein